MGTITLVNVPDLKKLPEASVSNKSFQIKNLPPPTQFSWVNTILVSDFNEDGDIRDTKLIKLSNGQKGILSIHHNEKVKFHPI